MNEEYDFSTSKKNPYVRKLKMQVAILLDEETITYFKALAEKEDIPYQHLMGLYLRDCALKHKSLHIDWK